MDHANWCITLSYPQNNSWIVPLDRGGDSPRDMQQFDQCNMTAVTAVTWLITSRELGLPWPLVQGPLSFLCHWSKVQESQLPNFHFGWKSNFKGLAGITFPDSQAFGNGWYMFPEILSVWRIKKGTYFCFTQKHVIPRTRHVFLNFHITEICANGRDRKVLSWLKTWILLQRDLLGCKTY